MSAPQSASPSDLPTGADLTPSAAPAQSLAQKHAKITFLKGFFIAFQGLPWVFGHPNQLALSLIPIALNLAIGIGVFALGVHYNQDLLTWIFTWPKPDPWWLLTLWWISYALVQLVLFAGLALISFLFVVVIGSIIAAPFHEMLSSAVEKAEGGSSTDSAVAQRNFLTDIAAALRDQTILLLIYLSGLLGLALLHLIPALGSIAASTLSLLWTWWFFALEFSDGPLSRWGLNWSEKWRFIRGSTMASLGFGLGAWLMLFIPLTLPFLVVSGTLFSLALRPSDQIKPQG